MIATGLVVLAVGSVALGAFCAYVQVHAGVCLALVASIPAAATTAATLLILAGTS